MWLLKTCVYVLHHHVAGKGMWVVTMWLVKTLLMCVAGFTMSAGIACNKLLAKIGSAMHKPNQQTVVPPRLLIPPPTHVGVCLPKSLLVHLTNHQRLDM
jgi:hypothetical protein